MQMIAWKSPSLDNVSVISSHKICMSLLQFHIAYILYLGPLNIYLFENQAIIMYIRHQHVIYIVIGWGGRRF